ncbi:MAG: hypothetical protein AAFR87_31890 [Bacteroidota bacterium]
MNKLIFKARLFQEKPSNIWDDRNRLNKIISLFALAIVGLVLYDNAFNNKIIGSILVVLLILKLRLHIGKYDIEKKSTLEGGFIEIFRDRINFGKHSVKISDINSVNLKVDDHYEKMRNRNSRDMRPFYSQGFDNELEITTKSKQNFTLRFQLINKEHKLRLIPFSYLLIENKIITREMGAKYLNLTKHKEREAYFKNFEKHKS